MERGHSQRVLGSITRKGVGRLKGLPETTTVVTSGTHAPSLWPLEHRSWRFSHTYEVELSGHLGNLAVSPTRGTPLTVPFSLGSIQLWGPLRPLYPGVASESRIPHKWPHYIPKELLTVWACWRGTDLLCTG